MKRKFFLFFGKLFNTWAYRKHVLESNVPPDFIEWMENNTRIDPALEISMDGFESAIKSKYKYFEEIRRETFIKWIDAWCEYYKYSTSKKYEFVRVHNGRKWSIIRSIIIYKTQ